VEDGPYISFGTLRIYEPATLLTSFVIAALCFIFYARIKKDPARKDINSWRLFFLFLGISSIIGNFVHGIHKQWGEEAFRYFNLSRNICSLLASFFCFRGTLYLAVKNEKTLRTANTGLLIYLACVIVATIILNHFIIVIINAGIFILYTLITHIIQYRKGNPGSGWILASFGIAPLPICVHLFKISFNDYFNQKDIAHIFIWISLWLLYRGIKVMAEEKKAT
jgi:predicted MFS family arabinose efflux permease